MSKENGESPGTAIPGELITVPIEEYGKGSYKLCELVAAVVELDPKIHSVNLLLE